MSAPPDDAGPVAAGPVNDALSAVNALALSALATPEQFGFGTGIWYAINAPLWMVATHTDHTLAGRLSMEVPALASLLESAKLWGKGIKPKTFHKRLQEYRTSSTRVCLYF